MSSGLTIRAATPEDRTATITLWQACGLTVAHNPPGADFDRAVQSPSSDVLLAEMDGQLTGSVMVGDDGHRAVVYYLGVDPSLQQSGLGRKLMTAAEDWAGSRGARKLNLMIRVANLSVRDFYAALDYEETPRLVMAKWLDR